MKLLAQAGHDACWHVNGLSLGPQNGGGRRKSRGSAYSESSHTLRWNLHQKRNVKKHLRQIAGGVNSLRSSVYMSSGEKYSQQSAEELGLLEKQKTDAWLKYGRGAPPPSRPVVQRAKWVRPGYAEPTRQPIPGRKGEGHQRRSKQSTIEQAVGAIQQATSLSEVEEALDSLETTGLKVLVFVELVNRKDVEHSKQVLELLRTQKVDKLVVSSNKLMSLLLEEKRVQEAEQLLKDMKMWGAEPNEASYNILITSLVNQGLLKQADYHSKALDSLLKGIAAEGPGERDFGFRSLTVAYARRGMIAQGLALLQTHKDAGLDVGTLAYNKLLEGCARKESLQQADKVLKLMKDAGTKPDIATYTILLGLYIKKALLPEAEGVLQAAIAEGLKPDTRFFSMLMAAYAERGQVEKSEEMLQRMETEGCPADTVTFNTLVDAYAKQGNIEGGERLVERMEAAGLKPNVVTFTTLIAAWAKQKQLDKAEAVLERMISAGLEPNTFTYTALINGYAKSERFQQASELLERMKQAGVKPTTVTYNALLTAYASAGAFGRADQLLKEMQASGCPPSSVTYSVLLSEYYKHGKEAEAARLKDKLKGTELYDTLTRSNSKAARIRS